MGELEAKQEEDVVEVGKQGGDMISSVRALCASPAFQASALDDTRNPVLRPAALDQFYHHYLPVDCI